MRASTLLSHLLVTLLFASTTARPIHPFHPFLSKQKLKARQFEEELAAAAEDSVELFDAPRVHDSTEQVHQRTEQHNVTTSSILAAIREKEEAVTLQRTHRLPLASSGEGEFSYYRESQGVGMYSQQNGRGSDRIAGYLVDGRQSGFGRYRVGDAANQ
ncbi:hypothetical protein EX895_005094 [Sporisorium graminicola]|uniref:Uncharacterized protein n=1 Tax=Sporisorium graminicola TaxID=280036 RepID=A0A4V6YEM2_9BASI|nr:hypothetical protein EX895_005094 [Sporisorium graminicola]TKY86269.1 hypothetical protein EX895_005094 [Sporisorium graminicola]